MNTPELVKALEEMALRHQDLSKDMCDVYRKDMAGEARILRSLIARLKEEPEQKVLADGWALDEHLRVRIVAVEEGSE